MLALKQVNFGTSSPEVSQNHFIIPWTLILELINGLIVYILLSIWNLLQMILNKIEWDYSTLRRAYKSAISATCLQLSCSRLNSFKEHLIFWRKANSFVKIMTMAERWPTITLLAIIESTMIACITWNIDKANLDRHCHTLKRQLRLSRLCLITAPKQTLTWIYAQCFLRWTDMILPCITHSVQSSLRSQIF